MLIPMTEKLREIVEAKAHFDALGLSFERQAQLRQQAEAARNWKLEKQISACMLHLAKEMRDAPKPWVRIPKLRPLRIMVDTDGNDIVEDEDGR
jgi:hypothetical protein